MGTVDSYTKQFMKDNRRFADVYNFLLGKKVVDPERLTSVEVEELYISTKLPGDTDRDVSKFRDLMKQYAVAKTDGEVSYVLLGIENQTQVDYAMPVRVLIYDAMRYHMQLRELAAKHKVQKDSKNGEVFVSGFHRSDRLKPVITVVVYYGSKPWDASLDLYGLLDESYREFLPLVNNYEIKVFEASTMSDEELKLLENNLRCVMSFIKASDDKNKLGKILEEDESFKRMDRLTVGLINAVTDSKLKYTEKGESVDMCKAIADIRNDARAEGRIKGVAEGRVKATFDLIKGMLANGLSLELIARCADMSLDEVEKIAAQVGE